MPNNFEELLKLFEETDGEKEIPGYTEKEKFLVDQLLKFKETELIDLWDLWIQKDAFYLHTLIPKIHARMNSPSEKLSLWVLQAGINYDEPSYNRYFIQSAIKHLGIERGSPLYNG